MYYLVVYLLFSFESFAVGVLTFEIQYCYLQKYLYINIYINYDYINGKIIDII